MTVIDDYLAKISPEQKTELERIRAIVHNSVPEVEEVIDYGMPAFKYKGKYLIGFAVFSNHLSLFPTADPLNAVKSQLDGYILSKGTIQFSLDHVIPEPVIHKLLRYRTYNIDRATEPTNSTDPH